MARWVQEWSDEEQRYVMVPRDSAAAKRDSEAGIIVRGNFDAFHSPVDGSLIRNHRDLEEHNRRNNVVSSSEFSDDWYKQKAQERARLYTGERSASERQARGEEIHRIIERLERQ